MDGAPVRGTILFVCLSACSMCMCMYVPCLFVCSMCVYTIMGGRPHYNYRWYIHHTHQLHFIHCIYTLGVYHTHAQLAA